MCVCVCVCIYVACSARPAIARHQVVYGGFVTLSRHLREGFLERNARVALLHLVLESVVCEEGGEVARRACQRTSAYVSLRQHTSA
jgi:hypothetical protein